MDSRVKNTKRNIIVSFSYTMLKMIFQFISRFVIIRYLGEQYLGLSSLFVSILHVLNMAELGFSGAIVFNMYKPIAENDLDTVCALLAYYKKIYRSIGIIIFAAGLIMMPLIPNLINGSYPDNMNIYFLFGLYLANTVISYFLFAYKSSLLEAMQRMDLVKKAYLLVDIIQYLFQIIALALFKNYYLFMIIMIIGTCASNITAACFAKKYYPQYECRGLLSREIKNDIKSRVKGLMICNISGVTYTTFDSIIISSFIGLISVAKYNNYMTVMNGITTIISLLRNAMQASVGNSVVKEAIEKNYEDMLLWQFLFSVIATWCTSCMMVLYQPFMKIWMGANMLLPFRDVIIICIWFNITVVQHSFFLYLSGNGLWWELRFPYIFSSICDLVLNLFLGKYYGVTGIIFASLTSSFIFGLIWQCLIIFKKYFQRSPLQFFGRQFIYLLVSAIVTGSAYFIL